MGGSSGGSSSGEVKFPDYIQEVHTQWLGSSNVPSVSSLMSDAMDKSPYFEVAPYPPDKDLIEMTTAANDFKTSVELLSKDTPLNEAMKKFFSAERIKEIDDAFIKDFDAQMVEEVYPRFEAGMRDINAVVSSAFVIGRAVIEDGRNRQIANFMTQRYDKMYSDDLIKIIDVKFKGAQVASAQLIEANRMKIVAKTEEQQSGLKMQEADVKWELDLYHYGGNLMAAPGGGTFVPDQKGVNKTQSALSGALSGAAMGAMAGSAIPVIGTAAGAVIGGVAGLAMGLMQQ